MIGASVGFLAGKECEDSNWCLYPNCDCAPRDLQLPPFLPPPPEVKRDLPMRFIFEGDTDRAHQYVNEARRLIATANFINDRRPIVTMVREVDEGVRIQVDRYFNDYQAVIYVEPLEEVEEEEEEEEHILVPTPIIPGNNWWHRGITLRINGSLSIKYFSCLMSSGEGYLAVCRAADFGVVNSIIAQGVVTPTEPRVYRGLTLTGLIHLHIVCERDRGTQSSVAYRDYGAESWVADWGPKDHGPLPHFEPKAYTLRPGRGGRPEDILGEDLYIGTEGMIDGYPAFGLG